MRVLENFETHVYFLFRASGIKLEDKHAITFLSYLVLIF